MMLVHLVSEVANLPLISDNPPGWEKLKGVINWVKVIAYLICGLGIIIAGAMMAIGQRRGEGGEHAARLGWVLAACIVIGSATAIVDQLK
ncbi:conjugal transfer protein TrbC [Kribbella sp. NPDC023972]|uniref:conjugal transfer protein TrbC n=1 Tax=Kribbella sp. NPDC023972 TaxID=3154795 RepID=UPI0033D15450